MEIRKASKEDYKTIYDIAVQTWDVAYKSILSEAQLDYMLDMMYSEKAFTEQLSINGHQFLIASVDGKELGFASYELNYRYEITKIHKLYVLPQTQGTGMGQALIKAIENIAKNNTNNKITLNVNRNNKAVHFYLKNGFENIGEEDVAIGSGYLMEDYIMLKELNF